MLLKSSVLAIALAFVTYETCSACDCAEQPDSSYARVVLAPGAASGPITLTISPHGSGETLASNGVTIEVVLHNPSGVPCPGQPAQEIQLFHPGLCICPGGAIADLPTDADGRTTFTGAIFGGGCAEQLNVYVVGTLLGSVPIRVNSPDSNADCNVDGGDLARFADALGSSDGQARYTYCLDFNENGSVDASDLARLAGALASTCR